MRLRQVKDDLGLSFSEFGRRLGLKKPTINAYVRGDNLAPLEVLEKSLDCMESQLIGFIMASLLIILLVILRKSDMVSF